MAVKIMPCNKKRSLKPVTMMLNQFIFPNAMRPHPTAECGLDKHQ